MFHEIKDSLRRLYLEDSRPWLVGFSGGKDSTMLAALIFDAAISVPADLRQKPVSVVCAGTRVEIPAIAEMVGGTLDGIRRASDQYGLNIEANLLKPILEQSFWVSIVGGGYPQVKATITAVSATLLGMGPQIGGPLIDRRFHGSRGRQGQIDHDRLS